MSNDEASQSINWQSATVFFYRPPGRGGGGVPPGLSPRGAAFPALFRLPSLAELFLCKSLKPINQ